MKILVPKNQNVLVEILKDVKTNFKLKFSIDESLIESKEICTLDNQECIQSIVDKVKLMHDGSDKLVTLAYEEGIHYHIYSQDSENTMAQFTLQVWVALCDGEEIYFGSSSSIPIPFKVGKEMGDLGISADQYISRILDDTVDTKEGYIGKITGGRLDKYNMLKQAVESAIIPIINNLK